MTQPLAEMKCEACRKGSPSATAEEIERWSAEIPEWDIVEVKGVPRLRRSFSFRTFRDALEFTRRVGELAEAENHHPRLVTAWGKVTVDWWTHAIGGLHKNDFVMAARADALA